MVSLSRPNLYFFLFSIFVWFLCWISFLVQVLKPRCFMTMSNIRDGKFVVRFHADQDTWQATNNMIFLCKILVVFIILYFQLSLHFSRLVKTAMHRESITSSFHCNNWCHSSDCTLLSLLVYPFACNYFIDIAMNYFLETRDFWNQVSESYSSSSNFYLFDMLWSLVLRFYWFPKLVIFELLMI